MTDEKIKAALKLIESETIILKNNILQNHFDKLHNLEHATKAAKITVSFMKKMTTDKTMLFVLEEVLNQLDIVKI